MNRWPATSSWYEHEGYRQNFFKPAHALFRPPHGRAVAIRCDVAVIGGGTGGCAAALAALRAGMRVVMTEETDWIGGQLTSQAVPPDEHPWIESFGGTRGLPGLSRRRSASTTATTTR